MHDRQFFIFPTTRHFIRALKEAEAHGIAHRVISVPQHISYECGMSIEVAADDASALGTLLTAAAINHTIEK